MIFITLYLNYPTKETYHFFTRTLMDIMNVCTEMCAGFNQTCYSANVKNQEMVSFIKKQDVLISNVLLYQMSQIIHENPWNYCKSTNTFTVSFTLMGPNLPRINQKPGTKIRGGHIWYWRQHSLDRDATFQVLTWFQVFSSDVTVSCTKV